MRSLIAIFVAGALLSTTAPSIAAPIQAKWGSKIVPGLWSVAGILVPTSFIIDRVSHDVCRVRYIGTTVSCPEH